MAQQSLWQSSYPTNVRRFALERASHLSSELCVADPPSPTFIFDADLLAWVSTNVNFLFGLCGTLSLVALRALLTWQADEGRVAAGFCSAALLLALSVVDEQVHVGGYADGLAQLILKYGQLTVSHVTDSRSPLLFGGLLVSTVSTFGAGSLVISGSSDRPPAASGSSGIPPAGAVRGSALSSTVTNAVVVEAEELAAVGDVGQPNMDAAGLAAADMEADVMAAGGTESTGAGGALEGGSDGGDIGGGA